MEDPAMYETEAERIARLDGQFAKIAEYARRGIPPVAGKSAAAPLVDVETGELMVPSTARRLRELNSECYSLSTQLLAAKARVKELSAELEGAKIALHTAIDELGDGGDE